ncbi:TPA: hypothetical protein DCQ44_00755 [Candidatus Taylorbacteria bacterium]|nr:hypothetical protein [Candidatus Taylorbacteria bacterium]
MNTIKSSLNKIFYRTDFSGLSVLGRGQHFDWRALLTFFLAVMIVSVSISVHVFLGVRAGDIFTSNSSIPVHNDAINKDALDKVIRSFDARAENLKNLQLQRPLFVDPSL